MEFSLSTIVAIIAVAFFIGAVVGWVAHARVVLAAMLDDPDHVIKMLNLYKTEITTEVNNITVLEMEVETDQGVFYIYEKSNKKFLGQGDTLELALEQVCNRFPDQRFQGLVSEEDAKKLGVV